MAAGRSGWQARVAVAVALAAGAAGALPPAVAGDLAGQAAPDFVLKATSGENLRLSEFRGQAVVLSFWADWCGTCRGHLDELAGLVRAQADRDVALLTVNIDSGASAAADVAARLGVTVLRDDAQAVARAYDLRDLPYTLIIDPDGRVRASYPRARAAAPGALAADLARVVAD